MGRPSDSSWPVSSPWAVSSTRGRGASGRQQCGPNLRRYSDRIRWRSTGTQCGDLGNAAESLTMADPWPVTGWSSAGEPSTSSYLPCLGQTPDPFIARLAEAPGGQNQMGAPDTVNSTRAAGPQTTAHHQYPRPERADAVRRSEESPLLPPLSPRPHAERLTLLRQEESWAPLQGGPAPECRGAVGQGR